MAPTERVHWDSEGVEVNPWLGRRVRFPWSSLLAVRRHKANMIFVYEIEGHVKQIAHTLAPEARQRLLDAWWEAQVDALERQGELTLVACPTTGGLAAVVGMVIGLCAVLGIALAGVLSAEPIAWPIWLNGVLFFSVFGVGLQVCVEGYLHQRRWRRVVLHRGGVRRMDALGYVTETPWHRVQIFGGRIEVDGARLKTRELSGEPLAVLILHAKGVHAPIPQSVSVWPLAGVGLVGALTWLAWSPSILPGALVGLLFLLTGGGPLFFWWARRLAARELPRWTARHADLARRCDWIVVPSSVLSYG